MKRFLICLAAAVAWPLVSTAAYTEFYAQTTGSNLFSGHTTDNSATFTAVAGTWVAATGVFTKSGANPVAGGVTNGAWAAVRPDSATSNVFVGRITAADDGADTITVSLLSKSGTAPADDAIGATTITVGGAWRGPGTGGSSNENTHPFNFVQNTMTNASGNSPRVNLKGTFNLTNNITHSQAGPIVWQGYTTTPGDGGKAVIDGGTTVATYILFTLSGINNSFTDLIFDHNGAAGNAVGVSVANGVESVWTRCVFRNMRQSGVSSVGGSLFVECEAYGNNTQNSAAQGGFNTGTDVLIRTIAHDHPTANSIGFNVGSGGSLWDCTTYNNGIGISAVSTTTFIASGCNVWSNAGAGLNLLGSSAMTAVIENCNLFKNGTFGINSSGSPIRTGSIYNCAFGSGTMTNASGNISTNILAGVQGGIDIQGTIIYGSGLTPWVDPTNGNFTPLTGAAGRASGRGSFTQSTINSPTNTVSFPDIGAAQGASTNAAAGSSEHSFSSAE